MTLPLVQLVVLYGAGLWVGLVALVPFALLPLAPVLLRARAPASWRWALASAVLAGFMVGSCTGGRPRCDTVLPRGPISLEVRTLDPPDGRGRQPARVAAGCEGDIMLRTRDSVGAGARVVVTGNHLGGGMVSVQAVRRLPGGATLVPRLRAVVAARIRGLYGARAPLVEALVLGRRNDVDPALREAFVAAGLAHLLAISGLHVGLVGSWIALLAGLAVGRRRAWIVAALAVWVYVLVLGFPPPATRAAAFITLIGTARRLGRHPPFSAILAAGVLTVLLVDPGAVTTVGAWLSVAAVWGAAEASRVARAAPAPLRLLAVSIGATLATAPVSALVFGQVAPVGVVANLVAVPLASVAVPGVFASLVLGGPMAAGAGALLAATETTARVAARVPFGHLVTVPGMRAALPWLALLVTVAWLIRARPRMHWLVPRLAAAVALMIWLPLARQVAAPRLHRSRSAQLQVFFLSVGQGDAIVIRTPHGRWLLVDAGPRDAHYDAGRDVVVPFLRRHGVRSLDAFLLSHGDLDHVGGAPAVLAAVGVDRVVEPGQPLGQAGYLDFLEAVDRAGAAWAAGRAGDTLRVDGVTIAVLHPDSSWIRTSLAPNENSLVLHLRYGAFDLLLTGDAGLPMERHLAVVPRVEVLKVGHHGSASATGPAWLRATGPKLAIIPVGRGNRYGHPALAVLDRLAAVSVPVARTDRDGLVTLTADGQYFEMSFGGPSPFFARILCALSPSRPLSLSSSSRSACTRRPAGSLPTSFTTWPSPARSSPLTSGAPD